MSFTIGIDIGTSGLKAVSVSEEGKVLHSVMVDYEPSHPRQGWSEQQPNDWSLAAIQAIRILKIKHVSDWPPSAIGFSGQMHGSVLLGRDGVPLTPALLWNDQRTADECKEIESLTGGKIIDWTLNGPRTAFTASKLLWTRRHLPQVWDSVDKIIMPKDYVRYILSGELATDVTDASGTNLFDVRNRTWSMQTLQALDIPFSMMPLVYESGEQVATTAGRFAREAGLPQGIPLVAGAADQAAAAIGMGVTQSGDLSVTLGTSGVVYLQTAEPLLDTTEALHTFCHAIPGTYQLMGGVLCAAGSFAWLQQMVNQFMRTIQVDMTSFVEHKLISYDQLIELAKLSPAGSRGLIFLPYLTGERSPYNDPYARGSWFGLTAGHTASDLTRSVLEGVAFALKDLLSVAQGLGADLQTVRLGGGGSKGKFWVNIFASVFGLPIEPVKVPDASAMGAALLAASVAYNVDIGTVARQWIEQQESVLPDAVEFDSYTDLYPIYRSLYPATNKNMHDLTAFVRKNEKGAIDG